MLQGRASFTARVAAFLRAAQQTLPEAERISQDPYALEMISSGWERKLASWGRFTRWLNGWKPGVLDVISTRDRFADEHARQVLASGGQLVMLGAGLDTMPWRLATIAAPVTIFEVDFPATQDYRTGVITQSRLQPPPGNVVRVAMDFEADSLVDRLREAGLNSDLPTLVNWMGVSYYLDYSAVASVLCDVRSLTNPASMLVFDFFQPDEKGVTPKLLDKTGEPLKFFICAEDFPAFVEEQGFEVAELASFDELAERYSGRRPKSDPPAMAAAIRVRPSESA